MDNHYSLFKQNLSKIEIQFHKLIHQNQPSSNQPEKQTANAKKVAILLQKYMDQSPNMLYQIITRNLGKSYLTWDDLLKCLQDQFFLSYTVLKRQTKKFSISQAKWNNNQEFNKITQYFKDKQTNCIQGILKLNLPGINISQHSSQCDILAVLLEKQLIFYLIQQSRVVCSFEFKYHNVKQKLIKKQEQKLIKRQIALRQKQELDKMPLNQRRFSFIEINKDTSKAMKLSNKRMSMEQKTHSATSKIQSRSRLNSNASSQIQSFLKRTSTDIGVSDWRRKSAINKKEPTVKVRTNTTHKVFEYFQEATLENSLEIAKKFQQSRDSFQKYMIIDKKLLQKQINIQIQDIKISKKNFDFDVQLSKMKAMSRNLEKYKMSNSRNKNTSGEKLHSSFNEMGQYEKFQQYQSKQKNRMNKSGNSKNPTKKRFFSNTQDVKSNYTQPSVDKLLEDNKIGIVSYSFYENLLLISFYNRQVRLYRVKKNLQRLKQELIFQKQNQYLVLFVQIYRSLLTDKYNIILCSMRNGDSCIVKIYEIDTGVVTGTKSEKDIQERGQDKNQSQNAQKTLGVNNSEIIHEIFCCKLSFSPIFQNMMPLGIGAYNQKGNFSLIQTNNINPQLCNKSQQKNFQKVFHNLITGEVISFTSCKAHANLINLYLTCKNGYIYLIDKISAKIKLQKKVSQSMVSDIALIKSSTQILAVSKKGQLMIINSQNLQIMYYLETYINVKEDAKLLMIEQNKYIFYSSRYIKIIDIEENEQKLLEYQKPMKVYRNRIKIKKQQAMLNKQTGDIENKKSSIPNIGFDNEDQVQRLGNSFSSHKQHHGDKFKGKFTKRKISKFFPITNGQIPHYILVLQNGQILVYDYKAEYFGSYLKNKNMQVKHCLMDKKMHYLGIIYTNYVTEVINLYNQLSILRYPTQKANQENTNERNERLIGSGNNQNRRYSFCEQEEQLEIILINFINNSTANDALNISMQNQDQSLGHPQFFIFVSKEFDISFFNTKGVKTRVVQIGRYFSESFFSLSTYSHNNTVYKNIVQTMILDKNNILMLGNQKGEISIHQKNTFLFMKSIKISYYPILRIQPFSKTSALLPSKQRSKYLLILSENNQIFLFNKDNRIFQKIYKSRKEILQGKYILRQREKQKQKQKQKQKDTLKVTVNNKNQKSKIQKKQILKDDQIVSSTHYFNKIVAFNQLLVVYEWEQIYEKAILLQQGQTQAQNLPNNFNLKQSLNSFVQTKSKKQNQKQTLISSSTSPSFQIKKYKKTGYMIERVPSFKHIIDGTNNHKIQKKNITSEISQLKRRDSIINTQIFTPLQNENYLFFEIWNTEDDKNYKSEQMQIGKFKGKYNNNDWSNHSNDKVKQTKQKLVNPYQKFCFVDSYKLTIILQPQQQFYGGEKNSTMHKSVQKRQNHSRMSSILMSRKSSIDSCDESIPLHLNQRSISLSRSKEKTTQKRQKTTIKVYDMEKFITEGNKDNTNKGLTKLILQQKL